MQQPSHHTATGYKITLSPTGIDSTGTHSSKGEKYAIGINFDGNGVLQHQQQQQEASFFMLARHYSRVSLFPDVVFFPYSFIRIRMLIGIAIFFNELTTVSIYNTDENTHP